MIEIITHLSAVAFGILIGGAVTRYRVGKRQSSRRDLAAQLRSPIDLEPCEFTGFWRERV